MLILDLGFDFVISFYFILMISIIVILVITLWITFHYENQRETNYQDNLRFHNDHNLFRNQVNEKLSIMSIEDYIDYRRNHFSSIASLAFSMSNPADIEIENFGLKMEYYWDCKNELKYFQSDILKLWEDFFYFIESSLDGYESFKSDLLFLAKLTRLSNISEEKREELDTQLLNFIDKNYPRDFTYSFHEKLEYILGWAKFRILDGYIDIMRLGVSIREVENLKHFWNNNETEFLRLRNEKPSYAKMYYNVLSDCFDRFSEEMNSRFVSLYKSVSLWIMEVLKKEDSSSEYSDVVIKYRRIARKNKRGFKLYWDYILDYVTGYGEKPHFLIGYFLASILGFTILYYPYSFSVFEFKGINKEDYWLTSLINVTYFNFTTMISNLYGNISPENELAKSVVILQQILGFTLSGSFIALFLRKVFRD